MTPRLGSPIITQLMLAALAMTVGVHTGCSKPAQSQLLHTVSVREQAVFVPAHGELEATQSTVITAPVSGPPKFIAWLAPEFSRVKKGEVIVRFGGERMQVDKREAEGELALSLQDLREKKGALDSDQNKVLQDIQQVAAEKGFAERFTVDDERIKSRLEILDDQLDTRYLGEKLDFLSWQKGRFVETAKGEIDVLSSQESKHREKLQRLNEGLSALEIQAPHDGLLTYEANWRGDKPQVGTQIWPGRKVGDLPDIRQMQARLYVADREATGLSAGQPATLWLDSLPEQHFEATVAEVSQAPSTIERGNPLKYYEVLLQLAEQQPALFKLGRSVSARIQVSSAAKRLEIPAQSLFQDRIGNFVQRFSDGEFRRQAVTVGTRTSTHVEITDGLSSGDQIALFEVNTTLAP
ncbi:efflux RND transporter periplasmic adaptor subunit [Microbulbifer elongatus]|uniref:efflux RND transporter periplasmic adaptor subunit n=1 Tax=Microbulbifer elongatus TaxID=86173 RepID=UPI001CFDBF19|nr:HlyD family efflux transporter periplasmic adaptor subunit [Microbulbifer elongatus]